MNQGSPLKSSFIASPGFPFIAGGILVMLLGWVMGVYSLAWLGLVAALFFTYFFRDPERPLPQDPDAIVAPADGKVIRVDEVVDADLGRRRRLAIFMNVFDVHVNRAPAAGTVVASEHHAGRFLAAFRDDADQANERQVTILDTDNGRLKVVQIAGLLARRIIVYVKPDDQLTRGQRFGMICFGSRVDLYLPLEARITVKKGDRVKAGQSVMARWA